MKYHPRTARNPLLGRPNSSVPPLYSNCSSCWPLPSIPPDVAANPPPEMPLGPSATAPPQMPPGPSVRERRCRCPRAFRESAAAAFHSRAARWARGGKGGGGFYQQDGANLWRQRNPVIAHIGSTPPSPTRSTSYNAATTRCFASHHARKPATNSYSLENGDHSRAR